MKAKFLIGFGARSFAFQKNFVFLTVIFFAIPTGGFGQTTLLTRAQFSRYSVLERAVSFEPAMARIALEEQVDPYILWTIAYNETRFRPWLKSSAGAEGLMQFMPGTSARFNLFDPYHPEAAIRAAARYVRFLARRFGGRIDSILAGYNAGEGTVDAYLTGRTVRIEKKIINARGVKTVGGIPPFRETVGYVARGLIVYRLLKARQAFPGAFQTFVYPPAVSESVARLRLTEPEIGFTGTLLAQINNPILLSAQTPAAQDSSVSAAPYGKTARSKIKPAGRVRRDGSIPQPGTSVIAVPDANIESTSETLARIDAKTDESTSTSNEVFYEPRTGKRWVQNRNGKIVTPAESGERIVSSQIRVTTLTTSRARSSFFGGSNNRDHQVPDK